MIPEMDTLLANYEHGLLSRRELLGALGRRGAGGATGG